jgi:hypothetical protein
VVVVAGYTAGNAADASRTNRWNPDSSTPPTLTILATLAVPSTVVAATGIINGIVSDATPTPTFTTITYINEGTENPTNASEEPKNSD